MEDQGNAEQKPRRSLAELAAEAGRQPGDVRVRMCPECGRRLFYVQRTWTLRDGTIRRARACSACGHVANSSEVFDGD